MPEFTQEELDALVKQTIGESPITGTGVPTNQAADVTALGAQPVTQSRPPARSFVQRNQRQGIPLFEEPPPKMLEGEVSPGSVLPGDKGIQMADTKAMTLIRENPEDQVAYLEGIYGRGNVRMSDNQRPIVTVMDADTGSPVEFSLLGESTTPSDVYANLVAMAPEAVGAYLGARGGGTVPTKNRFLKFAATSIGGALGQQTSAALKDAVVSSSPLTEILEKRGSELPAVAVTDMALTAAAKPVGMMLSPFSSTASSEVRKGVEEAVDYFKKKGIDYPMSAGEETGSSILSRIESAMSKNPGSSRSFEALQTRKLDAFREIQQKMLSSGVDEADIGMLNKLAEDIGGDAITLLKSKINPLQEAQLAAKNQAVSEVNKTIMDEIGTAAGPVRELYPEKVGQSIREAVFREKEKFSGKAAELYQKARDLGGTDKVLDLGNLAARADALKAEQASILKKTTKPSAIVGPTGQPINITTQGTELVREFIPDKVLSTLDEISSWKTSKASLDDLIKVRNSISDLIEAGEALPGIETKYLNKVRGEITDTIKTELGKMPDDSLKNAWEEANKFYAEGAPGFAKGAGAFERREIARLFRDIDSGAFVRDEDIIKNIGSTEYNAFKEFLGPTSPEFTRVKRAIADRLVEDATPLGGELVDGSRFVSNLKSLVDNKRAVADDIFGAETVKKLGNLGKTQQILLEEGMVDKKQLTELLATSPSNIADKLKTLAATQRNLNKNYRSAILKDIGEGKLGENFDAQEFVTRMYKSSSPEEVGEVVKLLKDKPETLDNLRRKVMEKIFYESQSAVKSGDKSRIGKGDLFGTTNTSALEDVIGTEDNKAKLTALLGKERMEDLRQLGGLLRGGEVAEKTFKGASTFAAASQINQLLSGGPMAYLSDFIKQKIGAVIYSSDAVRKMLTNRGITQEKLARAVITSQPFITAMAEDFGSQQYQKAMDAIYNSIDRFEAQGPPGTPAVKNQEWVDRLISTNQPAQTNQKVFPAP